MKLSIYYSVLISTRIVSNVGGHSQKTRNGKNLLLKSMDSRLLHLLCVKMHEIASNDYLIRGLWGNYSYAEKGNALRKGISRLRDILEVDTALVVGNSFGEGYFLTLKGM